MPTATSSQRHRKLRSWQPPRTSHPIHLWWGTRKGPCTSPHLPDSDSLELRSTEKLLRSQRRRLRSGSTTAPRLHPTRKSTTYLEGTRARAITAAITTLEASSPNARSTKRAPSAYARLNPRRTTTKENSVELDASADPSGGHGCRGTSSFLRTL